MVPEARSEMSVNWHETIILKANMQRISRRVAVAGAAGLLIGYAAGTWNTGVVNAAKNPARELLELDREFDSATAREGVDGWLSYFAPSGMMMPANHEIVIGQAAIREFASKAFTSPGFSLRWEPIDADVSGGLGYTYGISKVMRTGADGKPVQSYGKYVTIWRKQRDKTWKIAVDIGNPSPPPEEKK
jgi:ketosteroid isomerase-like protein